MIGQRSIDEGEELVDEELFAHHPDAFAVGKQDALPHTPSDAEVRVASLLRAVHATAHDGHGYRLRVGLQAPLDLFRKADDIDLRPAAGRATDQFRAAPAQAERGQDGPGCTDFFHRICRQRDADGVADALVEQDREARGGDDDAGPLALDGTAGLYVSGSIWTTTNSYDATLQKYKP